MDLLLETSSSRSFRIHALALPLIWSMPSHNFSHKIQSVANPRCSLWLNLFKFIIVKVITLPGRIMEGKQHDIRFSYFRYRINKVEDIRSVVIEA